MIGLLSIRSLLLRLYYSMVYRRISDDMKQRALQLLSDGWDIIEVVDVLGVSAKSVGRWQVNYETEGHVSNRYSVRGRRRKLSTAIMLEIEELLKEDPSLYLDEICEWLAVFHDVPISLGGLCMNLKDFGLDRKVMRKVASQCNESLRTQWMDYVLQTFTAEQMVFLDESSKDGRTLARKFGRARTGVTPEMSVDHNRGDRWSILPALTIDGYIALRVVEDSVDSMELYDFVLNDLVSDSDWL